MNIMLNPWQERSVGQKRSLDEHKKHCDDLGYHQSLYGVIQGGRWEDLRRSTCKKYAQMDFDGYGLGGAFLKKKH